MKLVDNLYCYIWPGRGNNCNSYLFANALRGASPHVLINPGHIVNELNERCLEHLVSSIERDGFRAEDIGLIINTHAPPDHCQANRALVEKTGGKALVTLHQNEDLYRKTIGRGLAEMYGRETDFEPNFYLKEGDLNLGQENRLNLKIIHTPGHSPGSITIYWPQRKALIPGDLVFYGAIGRTDVPGGDSGLLRQSIERLSELDVEYLLPGHSTQLGNVITGKEGVRQNFALIKLNYFPLL